MIPLQRLVHVNPNTEILAAIQTMDDANVNQVPVLSDGEELVGMLLIVCASLGLGYCQLMKGNISIDIVTSRLKPRGQAGMNIISYLMSFVVSVIISWRGFLLMHQYMVEKLGSISAILGILLWPFMLIMSLSFAWVSVIFLYDVYYAFRMVLRK